MNTRGQSLIELVMVLPILIAFWASIVWFAQVVIVSTELIHTARHGVFWLAYHDDPNMSASEERQRVHDECTAFLSSQSPSLDMSRVRVTVQPGDRWQPIGPRNLIDIPGIIRMVVHLKRTLKDAAGLIKFQPAAVTIQYDLAVSPLLRVIPGFPQSIPLRGFCVCYR